MPSVTLAVTDQDHPVPGFAVEAVRDLFFMHDPEVKDWVTRHRLKGAFVIVADPEWVNRGQTASLTIPVDQQDAEAVAAILANLKGRDHEAE
jgi:hypothetical protein